MLIAGRILWMTRRIGRLTNTTDDGNTLGRAGAIIIESAAVYLSCLIILSILYLCGSYGQFVLWNVMTQIIVSSPQCVNYDDDADFRGWKAIIFSLIIVRVARGASTAVVNDNLTDIMFHHVSTARTGSHILTSDIVV